VFLVNAKRQCLTPPNTPKSFTSFDNECNMEAGTVKSISVYRQTREIHIIALLA
jgi:hypothetical protein